MKSFIFSIILLCGLIVSSIMHSYALDRITENIMEKTVFTAECIYNDDYSAALENINNMNEYIDSRRTILSAALDHNILNKIDEYVSQMEGYVSQEAKTDAIVSCGTLSKFLSNIPENYRLKIDNIL